MFPERLRALRRGKHLTLSQLAQLLNTQFPTDKEHRNTPQQIGNWERGVRTPSYVEVQKLASFFNVTMDYLTGLTENTTYDLARLFISDKSLQFNGQTLDSSDRYEIYQLISGYIHGKTGRPQPPTPTMKQEELDLGMDKNNHH
ncbi:helix-turn-helix domain-containing protein [Lentilactobacillus raoultii]|uniref:Helix-turn-helix domain-containing protein n=1 Tax=Lentilactobacillus raoultii TaxID=1987503 RepID=A0ABW3PMX9_9LACO|nr:helix-turn-helix transcriptional regulator [Lentilactobacillus raoultii]